MLKLMTDGVVKTVWSNRRRLLSRPVERGVSKGVIAHREMPPGIALPVDISGGRETHYSYASASNVFLLGLAIAKSQ
jgi:hypothetical protein